MTEKETSVGSSVGKLKSAAVAGLGLILVLAAYPAEGHHAISAKFDPERSVTLNGTVDKVDWLNPHVHIFMDVTQPGGAVQDWAIELESPVDLEQSGWSADSLEPGETIRVQGILARDGSRQAWGNTVSRRSGERVFAVSADAGPSASSALAGRPAPLRENGHPRLGPLPGEAGYWGNPSRTSLVEDGVEVEVDAEGLLANLEDAPKVAPFQPWALGVYKDRQQNHLKDDPMYLYCLPAGGPRQFQIPYGIQLVEELPRQRIFLLQGGANRNWKLIYMDGREQVGNIRGDFDNPLYLGRSVAEWQDDTLVIDTVGFNERFWFSNGGLPHTDRLHLIERISRPDFNTLQYEVTVDDPGAYTRTWKSSWTLEWIAGEEMPRYFCQDNRP